MIPSILQPFQTLSYIFFVKVFELCMNIEHDKTLFENICIPLFTSMVTFEVFTSSSGPCCLLWLAVFYKTRLSIIQYLRNWQLIDISKNEKNPPIYWFDYGSKHRVIRRWRKTSFRNIEHWTWNTDESAHTSKNANNNDRFDFGGSVGREICNIRMKIKMNS